MSPRLRRQQRNRSKALSITHIDNPSRLRQHTQQQLLRHNSAASNPARQAVQSLRISPRGRVHNQTAVNLAFVHLPKAIFSSPSFSQPEPRLLFTRRASMHAIQINQPQPIWPIQTYLKRIQVPIRRPVYGRVARRVPSRRRLNDLARPVDLLRDFQLRLCKWLRGLQRSEQVRDIQRPVHQPLHRDLEPPSHRKVSCQPQILRQRRLP